jgi:hypothetical protein
MLLKSKKKYMLFIADKHKNIQRVNVSKIFVVPSAFYQGCYDVRIYMPYWVYRDINTSSHGWEERVPTLIEENEAQESTGYFLSKPKLAEELIAGVIPDEDKIIELIAVARPMDKE